MTTTIYAVIKITIKSEFLPAEEAVDELTANCSYDFPSTDNVEVLTTEWLDTLTKWVG